MTEQFPEIKFKTVRLRLRIAGLFDFSNAGEAEAARKDIAEAIETLRRHGKVEATYDVDQ